MRQNRLLLQATKSIIHNTGCVISERKKGINSFQLTTNELDRSLMNNAYFPFGSVIGDKLYILAPLDNNNAKLIRVNDQFQLDTGNEPTCKNVVL
jgi:hypothetical protein